LTNFSAADVKCRHPGCFNDAYLPHDECYRHRVLTVGITLRGGAVRGKSGWNMTKNDWLREHMDADSEKDLLRQNRQDVDRA